MRYFEHRFFIPKFVLLFLCVASLLYSNSVSPVVCPELLHAAKQLPCQGVLRQSINGFVYLEVTNDFEKLSSWLPERGIVAAPHNGGIGAHVSVMWRLEGHEKGQLLPEFPEEGMVVSFVPIGIGKVEMTPGMPHSKAWKNVQYAWVIHVYAPQLEALRIRYGRSPKIEDHEFHITIGVKEFAKSRAIAPCAA